MKTDTLNNLFSDLNIEISADVSDFFESGHDNLSDYCHESADGSSDVIYYRKAEELYNNASFFERDQAEDTVDDCGGFGENKTVAERFTILAYWITYQREMESLAAEIESIKEALEDAMECRSNRQKWLVIAEEVIDELECA